MIQIPDRTNEIIKNMVTLVEDELNADTIHEVNLVRIEKAIELISIVGHISGKINLAK